MGKSLPMDFLQDGHETRNPEANHLLGALVEAERKSYHPTLIPGHTMRNSGTKMAAAASCGPEVASVVSLG